jgi:hypothetical protein
MGFLSRLGKVATGIGGALQAPIGLVKDLATAPFVDKDEYDGFINTIYGRTVARGGQLLGNALGPQEGLGAVIGGLPQTGIRDPGRAVIHPILSGLETAGREGIREPLAAAVNAASLADAPGGGGLGGLLRGENWRKGYKMAQHRSLGQSIALAIQTKNINDDAEVARAMDTDVYKAISGTTDALTRLYLDPAIMALEVTKIARFAPVAGEIAKTGKLTNAFDRTIVKGISKASETAFPKLTEKGILRRVIVTGDDIKAALEHPALPLVNEKIAQIKEEAGLGRPVEPPVSPAVEALPAPAAGPAPTTAELANRAAAVDRSAARIRDLAFHNHPQGEAISRILAEADDPATVWPALLGDETARQALEVSQPAIEGQISRLVGRQAELAGYRLREGQLPYGLEQAELSMVEAELDQLYNAAERTQRAIDAGATLKQIPRISGMSETRSAITRSDFFQASPWAKPLRLATRMRPHGMVSLHEAQGDIQIQRFGTKAGDTLENVDGFRGQYMNATTPTERAIVVDRAVESGIRALAEKHGIPANVVDRLVEESQRLSGAAHEHLAKSRIYDADGKFSILDMVDEMGNEHRIHLPGAATQEFNYRALPNLDTIELAFKRFAREEARNLAPGARAVAGKATEAGVDLVARYGKDALDVFHSVWKPSVLIRAGWPIRVVGEEQIRIISKLGVLATMKNTSVSGVRYGKDLIGDILTNVNERLEGIPRSERRWADPETALQRGQGGRIGTMDVQGWEIPKAYGTPEDLKDVSIKLNSAGRTRDAFFGSAERANVEELRRASSGEWKSIAPSEASHGPAWESAVNNQIGRDAMWKQFLEGKTVDQVEDWVRNTAEGREYLSRVPHWRNNVNEWLTAAEEIAHSYAPTAELKAKALAGRARVKDLVEAFPNAADRPVVHGEILNEVVGKGVIRKKVVEMRNLAMDKLGRLPTDTLSRHPYFDAMYTNEVRRLVNIYGSQGAEYTPRLAEQIATKARAYALAESKSLLYDLSEQSEMGHLLRYVSPFYSAWQEVLTRWTGIASENPAFVARMQQVWRSPERAGIVSDEQGNIIHDDGTATDHLGNKAVAGGERFITLPIPKFAINDLTRHIPGVKGVEMMGGVKFNKTGFNTILTGAPGVGPLVQIPLNEIAKARPDLESSLKWALPFGTTQDVQDLILPAFAKRVKTLSAGDEDRVYSNTLTRIYFDALTDYNLGKRATKPDYAEAKKKTDAFYSMRVAASFVMPVAPQFFSPYQIQIDIYRNLKQADQAKDHNAPDYKTPDEIFLAEFGDEYFALTQSLSKSVDGIQPTLEGHEARQKYQPMIERHPELGSLIVGAEGAGEFNRAVYDSQLQSRVAPGSADMQRQSYSFEEAAAAPDVRLGWIEYQRYMDLIDAELHQRGLPNYKVKAAQDLASLKRQVTAKLAEKHPEWFTQFSQVDRQAMDRRLTGMREIAADKRLSGRQDIAGLGDYLRYRDMVTSELTKRKAAGGAGTLDAVANTDLDGIWEQIKTKLLERNLAFSSLYYRWLGNDRLEGEAAA